MEKEEVLINIRTVYHLFDDDDEELASIKDFELPRLMIIYRISLRGYSIDTAIKLSKYGKVVLLAL